MVRVFSISWNPVKSMPALDSVKSSWSGSESSGAEDSSVEPAGSGAAGSSGGASGASVMLPGSGADEAELVCVPPQPANRVQIMVNTNSKANKFFFMFIPPCENFLGRLDLSSVYGFGGPGARNNYRIPV